MHETLIQNCHVKKIAIDVEGRKKRSATVLFIMGLIAITGKANYRN